jgi:uncharacterized protein YndB with AHSA1/START domain
MFKKILAAIVVLLAAFAGVAALQSDSFRVTRDIAIAASPSDVFPLVNTPKSWELWSPWSKIDPNAVFSYSGAESGVTAVSSWSGNSEVGKGSSMIVETRPDSYIRFKLDFVEPMVSTAFAEFTFEPADGGTLVTWTMYGERNFIGKAMSLLMDCEGMMSDMFDEGLGNLRTLAESEPAAPAPVEEAAPKEAAEETAAPEPTSAE